MQNTANHGNPQETQENIGKPQEQCKKLIGKTQGKLKGKHRKTQGNTGWSQGNAGKTQEERRHAGTQARF